jgi:hypothetical protein
LETTGDGDRLGRSGAAQLERRTGLALVRHGAVILTVPDRQITDTERGGQPRPPGRVGITSSCCSVNERRASG